MNITYANERVEKYFQDYNKMKKKLPFEWVKAIRKHMIRLEEAKTFADFLSLGVGKPERLSGYKQIRYSLHVAAHARLIIELDATHETVMICSEVKVEGVCDYHGSKETWYTP